MKKLILSVRNVFAVQQKFDTRRQNRVDLQNELHRCHSLAELKKLREVLGWCVSDFDTADLLEILQQFHVREALLKIIHSQFDYRKYSSKEIVDYYWHSSYTACRAMQLFLDMTKDFYTPHQLQLYAEAFNIRVFELQQKNKMTL